MGKRERERERFRACVMMVEEELASEQLGQLIGQCSWETRAIPRLLNYASIRLARGRSRKNPFAALSRYAMEIGRDATRRACVRACMRAHARHRDPGRTTDANDRATDPDRQSN